MYTTVQVRSEFGKFAYTANTQLIWSSGIYPRVQNACISKHRGQKRSDWMFTINHPIVVNITNKCGAPSKKWFT